MNGTEFEANVWFSHQFSRHASGDNDLRRELALIRRSEQQQQKLLSAPEANGRNGCSSTQSAMNSSPSI